MLNVYYGWTKVNKIRKAEAISVIFENEKQDKKKRDAFLKRMQHTVYVRQQTQKEEEDAAENNRMYTEYSIRLDSKEIKGDVEKALQVNFEADVNNVSMEEREKIRTALRNHYKLYHEQDCHIK